jgi:hypothetical protein
MKRYKLDDYELYKHVQIRRSDQKWGSLTFDKQEFINSTNRIMGYLKDIKSICCLGIRDGNEFKISQELFKGCEVYGVDINPKVKEVAGSTLCCDFNNLPPNWTDKFDFVYSNSLDHAFDIKKTILEWRRICKGYILIRFAKHNINTADLYSFSKEDIKDLFPKDKFKIIDIWEYPDKPNNFNGFFEVIK